MPELNLGIIPGAGGTQRLSRVVGKGRALDMILTGKIIDGEEAERIGLVTYLAADDELEEKAEEVASQILKKARLQLSWQSLLSTKVLILTWRQPC